ncbi:lipid-A-disaccharide synthase [Lysobacter pythonis]|uniref:Lipid-A-disaccharide synthase n=1 Tax=Solilutibacter pythonis TaxID=2483112 RepID=A0A3M2HTY5_9GAMM|nr:lipid-A-disaccharide synthase [Lysobacter pythonis]RMH91140.1 lipid-A-disaccharide synthase [Lysobacter pythonis]
MTPRRPRIALCAGEASGDLLGAGLIEQLRARFPDAEFAGIGGPGMRAAGLDAWHDARELAVMGLAEVLAHLPRLLKLRTDFRRRALNWQPDVFIGIDAPDFNLGVEKWLKRRGIRTVHYVSPSVWAWRESRAAKIGQSADRVLCLFPMEPPIYAGYGVDAVFVGHPMADAIALRPDRTAARQALGLPDTASVLAVLPGSRQGEIERMLPAFLDAARQVRERIPSLRLLVPAANPEARERIETMLAGQSFPADAIRLLDGRAQTAMIAADGVLLASGTAALEAMLCKRPMVVGHRVSALTHRIVKTFGLLKSAHVSLPNVLAGEALVPELLQDECTPGNLASAVLHGFENAAARQALIPRFEAIHRQLRQDASRRAADAVAELLAPRP